MSTIRPWLFNEKLNIKYITVIGTSEEFIFNLILWYVLLLLCYYYIILFVNITSASRSCCQNWFLECYFPILKLNSLIERLNKWIFFKRLESNTLLTGRGKILFLYLCCVKFNAFGCTVCIWLVLTLLNIWHFKKGKVKNSFPLFFKCVRYMKVSESEKIGIILKFDYKTRKNGVNSEKNISDIYKPHFRVAYFMSKMQLTLVAMLRIKSMPFRKIGISVFGTYLAVLRLSYT